MTRIDKIRKAIRRQRVECPICKAGFWVTPKSGDVAAHAFESHVAEHAKIAAKGKLGKPVDQIRSLEAGGLIPTQSTISIEKLCEE